jgi:hypothetical protein
MLRTRLYQVSMMEVDPDEIRLAMDSFERQLPDLVPRLVSLPDFDEFYTPDNGAGTRCPLTLTAMLLLQFRYNVTDQELVERCRRDLGWRYATGLTVGEEPPGQATVQRFRAKLLALKGPDFLHQCVLKLAVSSGLIEDTALQAVDSTNTDCRGAVTDTFNLVANGIQCVVKAVARCLGVDARELAKKWKLTWYMHRSVKGHLLTDWTDEDARNELITEEIKAANRLSQLVVDLQVAPSSEVTEALDLLDRVARQDVEKLKDGSYRIAKGTAPGRIISITDPEARHGRKSSSKVINGFKTHLIGTIKSQFVTAIAVTDASTHDAKPTPVLIAQAEKSCLKPGELVGDMVYGTGANIRACQKKGVIIRTKMGTPSQKDSFPKTAFQIDLDAMRVTCPGAQSADRYTWVKADTKSDELVANFHFDKQACQNCGLRDRCCRDTREGGHRIVKLSAYERELQMTKAFNQTVRSAEVLRSRSSIERLISHLVKMGMRTARFFGMRMVQFQAYMVAAAYNLQRTITLMISQKGGIPHPI